MFPLTQQTQYYLPNPKNLIYLQIGWYRAERMI